MRRACERSWRPQGLKSLFGQGTDGGAGSATKHGAGQNGTAGNGRDGCTAGRTNGAARQGSLLLMGHVVTPCHGKAENGHDGNGDGTHGYL
ncbi:MAG TPA: hypothetical protein VL974_07820, partial [Magnetospirillum sp.]|nr:hypothetical protein [Magnetospirillum sp.]